MNTKTTTNNQKLKAGLSKDTTKYEAPKKAKVDYVQVLSYKVPSNKPVYVALTAIYGIGCSLGRSICHKAKVPTERRAYACSANDWNLIKNELQELELEGDLRKKKKMFIDDLIAIKCNKGIRHYKRFPANGQRTKSNAKTCRRTSKW